MRRFRCPLGSVLPSRWSLVLVLWTLAALLVHSTAVPRAGLGLEPLHMSLAFEYRLGGNTCPSIFRIGSAHKYNVSSSNPTELFFPASDIRVGENPCRSSTGAGMRTQAASSFRISRGEREAWQGMFHDSGAVGLQIWSAITENLEDSDWSVGEIRERIECGQKNVLNVSPFAVVRLRQRMELWPGSLQEAGTWLMLTPAYRRVSDSEVEKKDLPCMYVASLREDNEDSGIHRDPAEASSLFAEQSDFQEEQVELEPSVEGLQFNSNATVASPEPTTTQVSKIRSGGSVWTFVGIVPGVIGIGALAVFLIGMYIRSKKRKPPPPEPWPMSRGSTRNLARIASAQELA